LQFIGTTPCYERLVAICLGHRTAATTTVFIILNQSGALIGYCIVLLDLICPMLHSRLESTHISDFWLRILVMSLIAIAILFPTSLFRRLHNLAFVSWIAAVAILGTALTLMLEALTQQPSQVPFHATPVWWGEGLGTLRSLPLIVFSLQMHVQAVPIHAAVSTAEKRRKLRALIAPLALFTCATLSFVFGLVLSLALGVHAPSDVLKAYGDKNLGITITKTVMALHLSLGYPVVLFPAIQSVMFAFGIHEHSFIAHAVCVGIAVSTLSMVAVCMPQVSTVFAFTGATFSCALVYFFPAACYLRSGHAHPAASRPRILNCPDSRAGLPASRLDGFPEGLDQTLIATPYVVMCLAAVLCCACTAAQFM